MEYCKLFWHKLYVNCYFYKVDINLVPLYKCAGGRIVCNCETQ